MRGTKLTLTKLFMIALLGVSSVYSFSVFAATPGCDRYSREYGSPDYMAGYYPDWIDANIDDESGFCDEGVEVCRYPQPIQETSDRRRARIVGGQWEWDCKCDYFSDTPEIVTCHADVLPLETTSCLQNNIAYSETPRTTALNPLCEKAETHGQVDPGYPVIGNVEGGGNQERTWTCGGDYYNDVQCSAPSQAACAASIGEEMYDTLEESPALCDNGAIQQFAFNEDLRQWTWTCEGSAEEYDVACHANKTSTLGECNFIHNNKNFEELGTGENLCTKGQIEDFKLIDTDIDSAYGWTWTCAGSIPSMNDECFAHKTISKGICHPGLINNPQETLTGTDELCTQGEGTGLYLDATNRMWKWTCEGTRQKDNAQCSTNLKTTQGQCGPKNGDSCDTLTIEDELCEAGVAKSLEFNDATQQWTWYCEGTPADLSVQCSATKVVAGVCASITGQNFSYNDISNRSLCSIGIPDTTLPAIAPEGTWTRGCVGPGGGGVASCSAGQILDGLCANLTGSISVQPSVLCRQGLADYATNAGGRWVWACEGTNGGSTMQCEIPCTDGLCITSDITQADGNPTEIGAGETCYDPDGCMCGENRIFNGTVCSEVGPAGGSGDEVYDENYILPMFRQTLEDGFGSLYGPDMMLPGDADLALEHMALSSTGYRGDEIAFRLSYSNDGPDAAIGSYISYKFSPLLKNLSGSVPYTVGGETVSTGEATMNILYFFLGNLEPGQTGEVIVTGTLKKTLSGSAISNGAQIQSRLADPNPLNNTKWSNVPISDSFGSFVGRGSGMENFHLINPLLAIKVVIDKYNMIIDWIDAETVFRDVIPGYPRYMHIMTVQRNGIMQGYKYKYSTVFAPKKCISRGEYIMVMGRIMHTNGEMSDVYSSEHTSTPYKDVPTDKQNVVKYINRGHKRGLVDVFKAGKTHPDIMGIDKPVKHSEAKAILDKLYRMMEADTRVLKPLLVGNRNDNTMKTGSGTTSPQNSCLTREETAYTVSHILRGNPHIVMGFNDIFLEKLYTFLHPLSIKDRRDLISRLILKLKLIPASHLYKVGLDNETLIGILSAAMKGEQYQAVHDTSSVENFFYEVSEDEYDQYIESLYK